MAQKSKFKIKVGLRETGREKWTELSQDSSSSLVDKGSIKVVQFLTIYIKELMSQDSSINPATGFRLYGWGSISGRGKDFPIAIISRIAPVPT
jgi:hypothetical protein